MEVYFVVLVISNSFPTPKLSSFFLVESLPVPFAMLP